MLKDLPNQNSATGMNNKFKKIITLFFILMILVGVFGKITSVQAAEECNTADETKATNKPCNPQMGTCVVTNGISPEKFTESYLSCQNRKDLSNGIAADWTKGDAQVIDPVTQKPIESESKSPFQQAIGDSCTAFIPSPGCFAEFLYWGLYTPSAFILVIAAKLFNSLLNIGLGGQLLSGTFIKTGWVIVRDLSNIFFIIVLLFVAFEMILGIGGHDTKKAIANVVIMALLINFSLFFTEVVIDTTNVLALVFYNKLSTTYKDAQGNPVSPDVPSTTGEKDVSGALYRSFDPTTKLNSTNFFSDTTMANSITVDGQGVRSANSPGVLIGITLISSLIMLFAAYCFAVAGFAFLGRLIELWVLMIFSPFAFMSFSVPFLKDQEFIGWSVWTKSLLKASFMAPVFMFFMYFIFLLLQPPGLFDALKLKQDSLIGSLLTVLLPALFILILLLQATKFAKKGSGKVGDVISGLGSKVANLAGGLALGAATGGAATVGRATLGRAGAAAAESGWAKKWEANGWGGEYFRKTMSGVGSASFDARAVKIDGKSLASTGLKVGSAQKGGFMAARKEQVAKRQERAKSLEVGEDEKLKQDLNEVEEDLKNLMRAKAHQLEVLDKQIKGAREAQADAAAAAKADPLNEAKKIAAKEASDKVQDLRAEKKSIKDAKKVTSVTGKIFDGDKSENRSANGHSINELEDNLIPHAHDLLETENSRRKWIHAGTTEGALGQTKDFILSGGQHSFAGAREAAHKIRMGAKIEHAGKGSSGGHGEDHGGGHSAPASHAPAKAEAKHDSHAAGGKEHDTHK